MLRLFCFALFSFSSLCVRRSRGPSFNRPSVCRRPDSHTCFFLSFSFCLFGDVAFSEFFFVPLPLSPLYGEYVVRSFLPNGVFYVVGTGWIFYIGLLCENSINQSIGIILIQAAKKLIS